MAFWRGFKVLFLFCEVINIGLFRSSGSAWVNRFLVTIVRVVCRGRNYNFIFGCL
jgi:hypothetical protein